MPQVNWMRIWAERVALLCFGTLLGLLLLEVGLRVAATFVGPRAIESADRSQQRILTLGDSHTYGVYYPPGQSYPGQLQGELDERSPGRYRVLNLGLPGTNSSEIVRRLPEWLSRYRPRATIICVGINNVWNLSDTGEQASAGAVKRWWGSLRIARLSRLLELNLRGQLEIPSDTGRPAIKRVLLADGTEGVEHYDAETGKLLIRHQGNIKERFDLETAGRQLEADLSKMYEIHQRKQVEMILLTYAAFPLPGRELRHQGAARMSEEMATFSHLNKVRLIDVRSRFSTLLVGDTPRAEYFHTEQEGHPNPRGYAEIARLAADLFESRTDGEIQKER